MNVYAEEAKKSVDRRPEWNSISAFLLQIDHASQS